MSKICIYFYFKRTSCPNVVDFKEFPSNIRRLKKYIFLFHFLANTHEFPKDILKDPLSQ